MKFTIRNSVFETNSSSMHSFSWVKNFELSSLSIPKTVTFKTSNFNLHSELTGLELKASYLYTAAIKANRKNEFEQIIRNLARYLGFEYSFIYSCNNNIDHQSVYTAMKLLDKVLSNYVYLINFLFRNDTDCIITADCCEEEARYSKNRIKVGGVKYDEIYY